MIIKGSPDQKMIERDRACDERVLEVPSLVESRPSPRVPARGAPLFRLIDEGKARADLTERQEIKYTFDGVDVGHLRMLMRNLFRRQVHNNSVSIVRSIYFDDATFTALNANLDGLGHRRKLRLRWYDSPLPERTAFLEVKWRRNRLTGKHRMRLESSVDIGGLDYRTIRRELERAMPEKIETEFRGSPDPVLIVEYRREHFVVPDGSIRMTLDYDLRFYDQSGKRAPKLGFGVRLDGLKVLEGKTPVGREAELRELLAPFASRSSKCSKYVHGCRLLGLAPEVD